jgi:hypothetical protein
MPVMMVTSNTGNVTAMSVVIIANWLLAHLNSAWVMPPEVASAAQALVVWLVSEWSVGRRNRQNTAAVAQTVLAAPDPRTPSNDPAPPTEKAA